MNLADKIRRLRETLGLDQREFARRIGADQSVISKWERGKTTPNAERIAKLADLAGQTAGEFIGLRPLARRDVTARTYRVVGELQAGAWREAIEWEHEDQFEVATPMPPGMPDVPLRGYVVRGPSMNKIYPDGTLVFVASTIANGIRPKSGQRVLVQRRSREGLFEATLKEYEVREDGTKWLWPRSDDPEHQSPLPYNDKSSEEVTIMGVVMASFITEALR